MIETNQRQIRKRKAGVHKMAIDSMWFCLHLRQEVPHQFRDGDQSYLAIRAAKGQDDQKEKHIISQAVQAAGKKEIMHHLWDLCYAFLNS